VKNRARRVHATLRRHPLAADGALALVFAAAAMVSVTAIYDVIRTDDPSTHLPGTVATVLAMLAVNLPLTWRRRFPFTVVMVVIGAYLVSSAIVEVPEGAITVLAGSLAIYSAAAHGRRRFRTPVLALCLGGVLAEVVRQLFFAPNSGDLKPLLQTFALVYNAGLLALPWVAGAAIRSLRESKRELADRAAELQREREENARQAVFAERVRIARELHDVVAHHVSVMGVQAGAARSVMQRQPEKAAEALSSIEASSRQAVLEMHRLLGFLRGAGETDELAPQPGLGQLGELVVQAEQGDLTVELSIEGDPRPLSSTLEVSAYRVIQEALTNSRKHSGGSRATVRVIYGPATLEVEVLDNGRTRADGSAGAEGGQGLIGMRERASLHGGHLRAGPRPEGGFAVCATFPLNGSGS
jgi:signal transduction histidine kinase